MVESGDFVLKLTCVDADTHALLHASQLEVDGLLLGGGVGWEVSVFLGKFDFD